MKRLLSSHTKMISTGMGGVVLLKLIFRNLDYELCEGFDINRYFRFYYDKNYLYSYDRIFITDLHLNKENLDLINNDINLRDKVILFDHNESVTELNSYDFVNIIIKDDNGYCCSTSLLYEYLLANNMIKRTNALDVFCNSTRAYDTGQWDYSLKYEVARDLALLFDIVGTEHYINMMYNKLKRRKEFFFNSNEKKIIKIKKDYTEEKVSSYIQTAKFKKVDGYKVGIIFISYEFRNEIAQYLRKTKIFDIDFVILVSLDNSSLSIRNINPDVNVRPIAEKLGGKGHFGAAGCNIDENNFFKVLEVIL